MRLSTTLLLVAACSGSVRRQHATVAHLGFEIPGDWSSQEWTQRGTVTSTWTPEDNDRKESVTVIRSEIVPHVAQAGSPTLDRLLASAQAALPEARVSQVLPIVTHGGLSGVRVEVEYVPPGKHERYRRVHAVLVDGSSLVHVLYTAQTPDLATFNLVLDTLREEG